MHKNLHALPDEPARRDLGHVHIVDSGERDVRQIERVRAVGSKQLGCVGCCCVRVPEDLRKRLGFRAVPGKRWRPLPKSAWTSTTSAYAQLELSRLEWVHLHDDTPNTLLFLHLCQVL